MAHPADLARQTHKLQTSDRPEAVPGAGPAGGGSLPPEPQEPSPGLPSPLLHGQYTGTYIEDLLGDTERILARFDFHIADCDPYLYLANVKAHLANGVMDEGNVQAWWLIDDCPVARLDRARALPVSLPHQSNEDVA